MVRAFDTMVGGDALQSELRSLSGDTGKTLLVDMVKAGTTSSGNFQMSKTMDALLTPRVHGQVAADLSARRGQDAVAILERIGTQFFTDLAQS